MVMVQAKVEVVTAGSPRVFNPAGAAWYDANVGNTYRIVNNKDIVPSVPLESFGYVPSPCQMGSHGLQVAFPGMQKEMIIL